MAMSLHRPHQLVFERELFLIGARRTRHLQDQCVGYGRSRFLIPFVMKIGERRRPARKQQAPISAFHMC
ncbi:hypothetical protein AOQ73_14675 [Bradyrhizobium pachyrhizi]|nr:hypothetical protein AOQ73_14675 [Bradyrhizobium pachyrhizi]OMI11901.1 hypothetical protein BSN85_10555 [Bradyrhizobium brasilense]